MILLPYRFLRRLWLFVRLVWRLGPTGEYLRIKTAWQVASIIWGKDYVPSN
jgi:hypothetical protein